MEMHPHDIASETGKSESYGSGSDGSAPSHGPSLASRPRAASMLSLPSELYELARLPSCCPSSGNGQRIFRKRWLHCRRRRHVLLAEEHDSLPIWQTLPLCWLIGAVGVFCFKRTCFNPGNPPSAAEKKRHLFGDSWAAFCAGIACITAACLTALFTLCALVGLKLWWHWVLLYFGFFCGWLLLPWYFEQLQRVH